MEDELDENEAEIKKKMNEVDNRIRLKMLKTLNKIEKKDEGMYGKGFDVCWKVLVLMLLGLIFWRMDSVISHPHGWSSIRTFEMR